MDNAWFLQMVGSILHLVIGEEDLGRVVSMKICKTANMIKADETVHEVMVDVTANDENGDVPEEVLLNEDLTSWKQKYEELMVKYKQLENENSTLKKEIEEERTVEQTTVVHTVRDDKAESKRRRKSTNMFKKDEVVMAFWRDEISGEETWQEALVKFAYSDGKCRIEWKSDGMTSTAKQHELQKLV